MLLALLLAARTFGPQHLPEVADADDPLVDASQVVPGLVVELNYATSGNLTGRALYPPGAKCLLRRSVAERVAQAARLLQKKKLRLLAWDCTRPAEAQQALWKAHPHTGAVADPARGSLHQRGVAIDVALVSAEGKAVPLPTGFDAFGPAAYADAPVADPAAKANRDALIAAMTAAGFRVNPKEWWHFSRLYGWRWPAVKSTSAAP